MKTSSSSPESSTPAKRKVRFVICKFSYFEPPANWNAVDPSQLYYSRKEYAAVASDVHRTLQAMQGSEERRGQHELCFRGLENRTKYGRQRRELNHKNAIQAVLNEQIRQREEGDLDIDKVAKKYKHYSDHCAKTALATAIQDAIASRHQPIAKESPSESIHSHKDSQQESWPTTPRTASGFQMPPKIELKRFCGDGQFMRRKEFVKTNV